MWVTQPRHETDIASLLGTMEDHWSACSINQTIIFKSVIWLELHPMTLIDKKANQQMISDRLPRYVLVQYPLEYGNASIRGENPLWLVLDVRDNAKHKTSRHMHWQDLSTWCRKDGHGTENPLRQIVRYRMLSPNMVLLCRIQSVHIHTTNAGSVECFLDHHLTGVSLRTKGVFVLEEFGNSRLFKHNLLKWESVTRAKTCRLKWKGRPGGSVASRHWEQNLRHGPNLRRINGLNFTCQRFLQHSYTMTRSHNTLCDQRTARVWLCWIEFVASRMRGGKVNRQPRLQGIALIRKR